MNANFDKYKIKVPKRLQKHVTTGSFPQQMQFNEQMLDISPYSELELSPIEGKVGTFSNDKNFGGSKQLSTEKKLFSPQNMLKIKQLKSQ